MNDVLRVAIALLLYIEQKIVRKGDQGKDKHEYTGDEKIISFHLSYTVSLNPGFFLVAQNIKFMIFEVPLKMQLLSIT